jgi:hypothetical protein
MAPTLSNRDRPANTCPSNRGVILSAAQSKDLLLLLGGRIELPGPLLPSVCPATRSQSHSISGIARGAIHLFGKNIEATKFAVNSTMKKTQKSAECAK